MFQANLDIIEPIILLIESIFAYILDCSTGISSLKTFTYLLFSCKLLSAPLRILQTHKNQYIYNLYMRSNIAWRYIRNIFETILIIQLLHSVQQYQGLFISQQYKFNLMSGPLQKSLQGYSQFVPIGGNASMSMGQSLSGVSEKIPIPNASTLNRNELQRDRQLFNKMKIQQEIEREDIQDKRIEQELQEQQQNEFMNVGKWNKQKQSEIKDKYENNPSIKKVKQSEQSSVKQSQLKKKNQSKISQKQTKDVGKWKNQSQQREQVQESEQKMNKQFMDEEIQISKDEEEQQQQQEEEEEESEEEQEQESSSQQEQQESESEEQESEIQETEYQETQQNKSSLNRDAFQQSSENCRTQTVATSVANRITKPSKWVKKTELQTQTKYEKSQKVEERTSYRLNSAKFPKNQEEGEEEQIEEETKDQWENIQKILLRIKGLLI